MLHFLSINKEKKVKKKKKKKKGLIGDKMWIKNVEMRVMKWERVEMIIEKWNMCVRERERERDDICYNCEPSC